MGLEGSRFTAPTQLGFGVGGRGVLPCLTLSLFSSASFFGDGYVEMPLADASRTVRLHLQLYTSQGSGLLFLAAGQPDHLLLQLRASTLQVSTPPAGWGPWVRASSRARMKGQNLSRPLPGDVKSSRGEWTESWENLGRNRLQLGKLLTPCLRSIMETPRHRHPMYIAWCNGA